VCGLIAVRLAWERLAEPFAPRRGVACSGGSAPSSKEWPQSLLALDLLRPATPSVMAGIERGGVARPTVQMRLPAFALAGSGPATDSPRRQPTHI
jgi:hypothetical protein